MGTDSKTDASENIPLSTPERKNGDAQNQNPELSEPPPPSPIPNLDPPNPGSQAQKTARTSHVDTDNAIFVENIRDLHVHQMKVDNAEQGAAKKQVRELNLLEASKPMPRHAPQFLHESSDVKRWIEQLRESKLLLLSCYDPASLYAAAQAVAADLASYFQPFLLSFQLAPQAMSGTTIDPFLPSREGDPAALVVVDAIVVDSVAFVESLIRTPSSVDLIQKNLTENNRLMLLLTNNQILRWSEAPDRIRAERVHVPCQQVPFLEPRLRDYCLRHSIDNWETMNAKIRCQREAQHWEQDDEKFFQEMMEYMGRGLLEKEIEKRDQKQPSDALREVKQIDTDEMLSPRARIENAVLFLATFFPKLQMRDFGRLLASLLGNQSLSRKTQSYALSLDGTGSIEEVTEKLSLLEMWNETYPEVLKKCKLISRRSEEARVDGSSVITVVDFEEADLRNRIREAFAGTHAPLFFGLFRLVLQERFLADENPAVVKATIRLIVDTALANPREIAAPGLGGVAFVENTPISNDPVKPEVPLSRLYPLLRELLQQPTLCDMVTRFCNELLSRQRYNDLIELSWALRNAAGFDAFSWLQRMTDEGSEDVKVLVQAKLMRSVGTGDVADVIAGLQRWLPRAGTSSESPTSMVAASLFVRFNEKLLFEDRFNALLTTARQSKGKELARLWVAGLLHPSTTAIACQKIEEHYGQWVYFCLLPPLIRDYIFEEGNDELPLLHNFIGHWVEAESDPAISNPKLLNSLFFPAIIWAEWAVETLGVETPPPSSRELFEGLVIALIEGSDAPRRNILSILWAAMEESILDLLVFLEQLDPLPADFDRATVLAIRRDLQTRQRCVKQLRLDLKTRSRALATAR